MLHIVDPNAAGTDQKCACECLSKYPVILQGKTRIRALSQTKREFIFSKVPWPIPNKVRNPNECEYSFQISACKQVQCRSSLFVWVCANTAWPDCGIEVRSNKTHPISEKREILESSGQVEIDGIIQTKSSLCSPDFSSLDLEVSAHSLPLIGSWLSCS